MLPGDSHPVCSSDASTGVWQTDGTNGTVVGPYSNTPMHPNKLIPPQGTTEGGLDLELINFDVDFPMQPQWQEELPTARQPTTPPLDGAIVEPLYIPSLPAPVPYTPYNSTPLTSSASWSSDSSSQRPYLPAPLSRNDTQPSTPTPTPPSRADSFDLRVENLEWDTRGSKPGMYRVRCPACKQFVETGSFKQNTGPLRGHLNSTRKCKPRTLQDDVLAEAAATRAMIFGTPSRTTLQDGMTLPGARNAAANTSPSTPVSRLQGSLLSAGLAGQGRGCQDLAAPEGQADRNLQRDTTVNPTHSHLPPQLSQCPGIALAWPHDSFFETYPFQRHDARFSHLGYRFCGVDQNTGSVFRIRSEKCTGRALDDGEDTPCVPCQGSRATVDRLASLAMSAPSHTNYKYLNTAQLQQRCREYEEELRRLRMKDLNLGRKVATSLCQLEDRRRFTMAVANMDAPRVRQVIQQGLKDHASIAEITRRIEAAAEGLYRARGFDQGDLDLALLILRCGGRSLLWSMSEHSGLPSVRTLKRENIFTRIAPSCGIPTREDILRNIHDVFLQKREDLRRLRALLPLPSGAEIQMDEVALENVACYDEESDSAMGLCREHGSVVNARLSSYEDAEAIARALADGDVHFGSECSVIAVSSFSKFMRGALPVAVSPTCKKERPHETAELVRRVIAAWNEAGAAEFGPIWSFASDGDAGRRQMVYDIFMTRTVDRQHPLYKYVGRLPGLNLQVGDGDITADFDWKHEIKRMMRLLLTQEGVLIGNTILNIDTIRQHLRRDVNLSEAEIFNLTKATDTQDVPRAVRFLEKLGEIAALHRSTCDPSELKEIETIGLVAEMFLAFMHGFVKVDWSLTQQVASLSKYAHIAFALYREHGQNVMPHQLYGDTQTTVKNAIFCIAKQQQVDGEQPFYLFWLGDDRLEALFGIVRMIGGHNPNFTLLQLVDRLGAALDIDAVYTRHPELNPGHRRLNITRTEHKDHLNPESWIGNATANSVNLEVAWLTGRDEALQALQRFNITPDFKNIFDASREVDMLKPFGRNKFVGVSQEPDRSQESTTHPAPASTQQGSISSSEDDPDESILIISTLADDNGELSNEHSTDAHSESSSSSSTPLRPLPPTSATTLSASSGSSSDQPALETLSPNSSSPAQSLECEDDELTFEEVAGRIPRSQSATRSDGSAAMSHRSRPVPSNPWVIYKGRRIHKSTLCRLVITPDYVRKSHERILRVRGYSSDGKARQPIDADGVLDESAFVVGDLFLTFLRCEDRPCLAFMKAIAIEEKGVRLERVDGRKLQHSTAQIRVTGQVLEMRHVQGLSQLRSPASLISEEVAPRSLESEPDASGSASWIWTGDYVKLRLDHDRTSVAAPSPTSKAMRKTLAAKVAGHICKPVNPRIIDLTEWLGTSGSELPALNAFNHTWELTSAELSAIVDILWDTVKKLNATSAIPTFRTSPGFPYKDMKDQPALISDAGAVILQQEKLRSMGERFRCYKCLEDVEPGKGRTHNGVHILRRMRGVLEDLRGEQVGPNPCGFCGRSGLEACSRVFLTRTGQAQSDCSHAHKFHYRPALTSTEKSASTNVPIICTIPSCNSAVRYPNGLTGAIWKYNMPEHIRTAHPEYTLDGLEEDKVPLPSDLALAIAISREEEVRIGIPEDKIPPTAPPAQKRTTSKRQGSLKRTITHADGCPSKRACAGPLAGLR